MLITILALMRFVFCVSTRKLSKVRVSCTEQFMRQCTSFNFNCRGLKNN